MQLAISLYIICSMYIMHVMSSIANIMLYPVFCLLTMLIVFCLWFFMLCYILLFWYYYEKLIVILHVWIETSINWTWTIGVWDLFIWGGGGVEGGGGGACKFVALCPNHESIMPESPPDLKSRWAGVLFLYSSIQALGYRGYMELLYKFHRTRLLWQERKQK